MKGQGTARSELSLPAGVLVDTLGRVYVADMRNSRVVRWAQGMNMGEVIVGGNRAGPDDNQLNFPVGLSFDRDGNLYVADRYNYRVQRFSIEGNSKPG